MHFRSEIVRESQLIQLVIKKICVFFRCLKLLRLVRLVRLVRLLWCRLTRSLQLLRALVVCTWACPYKAVRQRDHRIPPDTTGYHGFAMAKACGKERNPQNFILTTVMKDAQNPLILPGDYQTSTEGVRWLASGRQSQGAAQRYRGG